MRGDLLIKQSDIHKSDELLKPRHDLVTCSYKEMLEAFHPRTFSGTGDEGEKHEAVTANEAKLLNSLRTSSTFSVGILAKAIQNAEEDVTKGIDAKKRRMK